MLYREIIAVCSEIHTKHINTLCGQNVELLNVKLSVHIVTTGLWMVKHRYKFTFMFPRQGWELSSDATDCAIACVTIGLEADVCGLSVDAACVSSSSKAASNIVLCWAS